MLKKIIFFLLIVLNCNQFLWANHSHSTGKKKHSKKSSSSKKKKAKPVEAALEATSYHTNLITSGDTLDWINAQMKLMNDTQRIGQLFMPAVWNNRDSVNSKNITEQISKYNIGGVIMMQGTPYRHAVHLNYLQSISKIPLLVGFDGEWGLGMRIDSTFSFPHQLTLGAIQNNKLIEQMGVMVGEQCKRLGIHLNFAPDVDVNNNPKNPVIGDRSFGENHENVASKAIVYMNGMQHAGILTCAKHFPGHGDTDVDSHADLPVLPFSRERLDTLELMPFKKMIEANVPSIMVAHLAIPQLEPDEKTPASLSQNIIEKLLKEELHYNGLVITDAMNMKGVQKNYSAGIADVKALLAGNDMLLISQDISTSVDEILKAIDKNLISQEEINNRVRKILYYKYKAGLNKYQPINLKNLQNDLSNDSIKKFIKQLYSEAFTTITDSKKYTTPANPKIALLNINGDSTSECTKIIVQNCEVKIFRINASKLENESNNLMDSLSDKNEVWIELHKMSRFASRNFGVQNAVVDFVNELSKKQNVHLILFGTPYALKYFNNCKQLMVAYEDNSLSQSAVAEILLNQFSSKGKLPVSADKKFVFGMGNVLQSNFNLIIKDEAIENAKAAGLNIEILNKMDSIALEGIAAKAYPGCQVVAMKDGKIIYNKTFGSRIYELNEPVKKSDLYDLASITKIACTTLACMKLYEDGKLDLNKTILDYLPEAKKTNKKKIVIKDLLLHQAGLVPFVPFWKECFNGKGELNEYFSTRADENHTLQVADNIFMDKKYMDIMWERIYKTDVKSSEKYVYSDLDLYFMKRICEKILKTETVESYVNRIFYEPLQLKTMCFNPLQHGFKKEQIAPTEHDNYFRHQLICGCVHDQGAAMCGGIQGHAGLFSNAEDLATLMQMLCNKGELNGKRYLKAYTVDHFTTKQSLVSRRGLGFDKQEPNPDLASPTCKSASVATFGHTGFTGTSAWVDPTYNLVFVFLSNRVYPDAENKKIITMGIRTRIQELLYEAMKK